MRYPPTQIQVNKKDLYGAKINFYYVFNIMLGSKIKTKL